MEKQNVVRKPLIGMTLGELESVAEEAGLRRFAAKQIARRLRGDD